MNNEDLTRMLLDKMEAVLSRTNELADSLNKVIGRLEMKESQCTQHHLEVARSHKRIDELEREFNQATGAKAFFVWLIPTVIALWGVFKDHVK